MTYLRLHVSKVYTNKLKWCKIQEQGIFLQQIKSMSEHWNKKDWNSSHQSDSKFVMKLKFELPTGCLIFLVLVDTLIVQIIVCTI